MTALLTWWLHILAARLSIFFWIIITGQEFASRKCTLTFSFTIVRLHYILFVLEYRKGLKVKMILLELLIMHKLITFKFFIVAVSAVV